MSRRHTRWMSWSVHGYWLHVWTVDGRWCLGLESDRTGRNYVFYGRDVD